MGPAEWKANPSTSRGGVVAGVLRDGDWNIAMKWLGDNGLCNNPDEKTYDSNCLNWVGTTDYIDAAEKYVADYCETRPVVKNGRKTDETKKICVNGVVTWTPGDVIVVRRKRAAWCRLSPHAPVQFGQMPNVVIGIDKWMKDNRPEGRGHGQGHRRRRRSSGSAYPLPPCGSAAEVSATVYNEKGTDATLIGSGTSVASTEKDKTGVNVDSRSDPRSTTWPTLCWLSG